MSVRLTDVRKSFGGLDVIHGVSMEIPQGGFGVFVGPSGCGKSTLLRMIAGLEQTDGGKIEIEGRDVTAVEPADREVAMVFQSYALYPHLSVYDNMAFSLKLARAPKAKTREMVHEAARILQLEEQLDKKPAQLSGGQRQRVAIGRAIVRQPKVFLFDEPLSNLDAELRVQMRLELTRLHRQLGTTMIYVTHDQVEAMTLADRIFVLRSGEVQQAGAPLELYDNPDNRFVGGFIGSPSMNFLPARVSGSADGMITCSPEGGEGATQQVRLSGELPGEGAEVLLGIRPEHLRVVEGGLRVRVEVAEELGDVSYLYTRMPDGREIIVERHRSRENLDGATIGIEADPADVLVFDGDTGQRMR
ncbi:carbohydrate ABC transporter ATP-binding protein, CUT1 family [Tranquillimonas rosea]|uniref:Carbohydrate ABC transporter ATP-binding protein, CUT1 family n=1 Tax=Tranquillimonas rosea TaxID=641238 RepID=A0A1H9W1E1_9RHOB|nr:sn-glycerol-3-phosphate ABC transporter ATP-binding protein UgpC [Tranquillimonas rosea]SES27732.1 carbohydrate ABC transporter ATP-binding protein, CUT1 family [Tranquillimonas rosea]